MLFDHYQVLQVLGHGAMGIVYLARDSRIGRLAALKTLKTSELPQSDESEEFLDRFKREAEVCGSLVHPNIVTLYEVGYSHRMIRYLAMEYVEGESLSTLVKRRQRLQIPLASQITLDVLAALDYAHERKIIHRDIKPANILVTDRGHAKIADFGVARYVREGISNVTKAGHLLGTPYYMPPEHISGKEIDGRADLFSVGVLYYELLSGRRPFEGTSIMDVLYDVVNEPAPPLRKIAPDLPRWCELYVERLLRKEPKERFVSAGAAAEELRRLLEIHNRDTGSSGQVPRLTDLVKRELPPEDTPTTPIKLSRKWWQSLVDRSISRRVAIPILLSLAFLAAIPFFMLGTAVGDETVSPNTDRAERRSSKRSGGCSMKRRSCSTQAHTSRLSSVTMRSSLSSPKLPAPRPAGTPHCSVSTRSNEQPPPPTLEPLNP